MDLPFPIGPAGRHLAKGRNARRRPASRAVSYSARPIWFDSLPPPLGHPQAELRLSPDATTRVAGDRRAGVHQAVSRGCCGAIREARRRRGLAALQATPQA